MAFSSTCQAAILNSRNRSSESSAKTMHERLTLGAIELGKRQVEAGVDAVLISSAFAGGGLISRGDYETFVLPNEKKLISKIHAAYPDVKIYTHTCGAIAFTSLPI
jgi:uroporphyrinogen-III decarboxylase